MTETTVHIDYLSKRADVQDQHIKDLDKKFDMLMKNLAEHMVDEEKAKGQIRLALAVTFLTASVGSGIQVWDAIKIAAPLVL